LTFPTTYAEAARGLWVTSASSPKYPPFEIRLIWKKGIKCYLLPLFIFSIFNDAVGSSDRKINEFEWVKKEVVMAKFKALF
jgi:hypothetical protein